MAVKDPGVSQDSAFAASLSQRPRAVNRRHSAARVALRMGLEAATKMSGPADRSVLAFDPDPPISAVPQEGRDACPGATWIHSCSGVCLPPSTRPKTSCRRLGLYKNPR